MTVAFLTWLWGILKALPWWVYLIVAAVFGFYSYGLYEHHQGYDEAEATYTAQYAIQIKALQDKQQTVITKTMVVYRDRIVHDKETSDAIQEAIVHAPEVLPSPMLVGGVRVLHDAAASGSLPDDPERASGTADPVAVATLLATVAANYQTCRADQEKLLALQTILKGVQ